MGGYQSCVSSFKMFVQKYSYKIIAQRISLIKDRLIVTRTKGNGSHIALEFGPIVLDWNISSLIVSNMSTIMWF